MITDTMADFHHMKVVLGLAVCLMTSLLSRDVDASPASSLDSSHPCRDLQPGVTTVAHPEFCHRYFNCTQPNDNTNVYLSPYELECPYLTLYSEVTGQCEHFTEVKCDERLELKDPCDFSANQVKAPTVDHAA